MWEIAKTGLGPYWEGQIYNMCNSWKPCSQSLIPKVKSQNPLTFSLTYLNSRKYVNSLSTRTNLKITYSFKTWRTFSYNSVMVSIRFCNNSSMAKRSMSKRLSCLLDIKKRYCYLLETNIGSSSHLLKWKSLLRNILRRKKIKLKKIHWTNISTRRLLSLTRTIR